MVCILQFSAFYGGKKTIGDKAKENISMGIIFALEPILKIFLANIPLIQIIIEQLATLEICERKIPYVIMGRESRSIDLGRTQQTYTNILRLNHW